MRTMKNDTNTSTTACYNDDEKDDEKLKEDTSDRTTNTIIHSMPMLRKVQIIPKNFPIGLDRLVYLEKIVDLRIEQSIQRGPVVYYVMDIYLYIQENISRIPTEQKKPPVKPNAPTYSLEKSFLEFNYFRRQMYQVSSPKDKHATYCRYCSDMNFYTFVEMALRPRLWYSRSQTKMENRRRKFLQKFMKRILALTLGRKICYQECEGMNSIPSMLETFIQLPIENLSTNHPTTTTTSFC